jgi:poly(3-hydroxybutyrate) depolymerase
MVSRLTDPQDLNVAPADGPVLLIGISNGGSMASRVAQHMDAAAVAIFVSNAVAFSEPGATLPPLMLCPGQNDPGYALGSNEELADDITAAGGLVIFSPNEPGPVTHGLFMRVEGIDCDLSKAIGQGLQDAGWLNADDTLAKDPKTDKSWQEALPATADVYEDQLSDVLLEAYAGHTPSSDQNDLVFDFFDAHDD